jgi:SH3-like domain-containing protein
MSNNEEWRYFRRTSDGHDVDVNGYDEHGHYHHNSGTSNSSSKPASGGSFNEGDFESRFMLVAARLLLLGLVVFILYKINQFVMENWITVATILGAFIVCVIPCFFIIHKGKGKPGLKIFIAIVASLGIMCALLYFDPIKTDALFINLQSGNPKSPTVTLEKEIIIGYVTSDTLNIRAKPDTNSKIIGHFSKDDWVEIIGKSGSWLKVNLRDSEVYIDSDYVRVVEEGTIIYGYVTADVLNIRSEPSVTAEIIGRLSKDDRVEITGKSGSWWWRVKFEDIEGYIESVYLRVGKLEEKEKGN